MATWDDVRVLALALPGVEEATSRGNAVWRVGKLVVWDRPMRVAEAITDAWPAVAPTKLVAEFEARG